MLEKSHWNLEIQLYPHFTLTKTEQKRCEKCTEICEEFVEQRNIPHSFVTLTVQLFSKYLTVLRDIYHLDFIEYTGYIRLMYLQNDSMHNSELYKHSEI